MTDKHFEIAPTNDNNEASKPGDKNGESIDANPESVIEPEYKEKSKIEKYIDYFFCIEERGTTIQAELYFGLIHYVSCFYCLAVIPSIGLSVGYDGESIFATTALCSGIGSILGGFLSNLPFPFAPPTAVAIYVKVRLLSVGLENGSPMIILSGIAIMVLGIPPIARFCKLLIPVSIQVGTSVGIGLVTALSGTVEIDLIVAGTTTIVMMGEITPDIVIALAGVVLIPILYHYHMKVCKCDKLNQ